MPSTSIINIVIVIINVIVTSPPPTKNFYGCAAAVNVSVTIVFALPNPAAVPTEITFMDMKDKH
jgi:hypothetical protein